MTWRERERKIKQTAENLKREGLKPELLIKQLYHDDSILAKDLQEDERRSHELTRDVYIEVLNLHKIENPRTTRVYRGLEQLYGTVHQLDKPPEGKGRPSQGHRRK